MQLVIPGQRMQDKIQRKVYLPYKKTYQIARDHWGQFQKWNCQRLNQITTMLLIEYNYNCSFESYKYNNFMKRLEKK